MLPAISPSRSASHPHRVQSLSRSSIAAQRMSVEVKNARSDARSKMPLSQEICLQLLREGHIQSYIEFFRMSKPQDAEDAPPQDLRNLKQLLTEAEDSERSGQLQQIYESRKNIARHFQAHRQYDVATRYYQDALQTAQMIQDDRDFETEATKNIGYMLEITGKTTDASKMFENSRRLAREQKNAEAENIAAKSLVSTRMRIAKQQEKNGNFAEAITQYIHCVEILQESCPDEQTLNNLNFRLGRAHQQNGDIPTAIKYLEIFLEKVRKYGDRSKEGLAQAVLASCYESAGDLQFASECLKKFLASTENDPSQRQAQAQACNHLGVLYNKMGEYDLAVRYFERHYELACTIAGEQPTPHGRDAAVDAGLGRSATRRTADDGVARSTDQGRSVEESPVVDSADGTEDLETGDASAKSNVGLAQVQLGISRANAYMDRFLEAVRDEKNLGLLLRWKATHSFEVFDGVQTSPRQTG